MRLTSPEAATAPGSEAAARCYGLVGDRPLGPCIRVIERCASNSGGKGCCPSACFDAFEAAKKTALSEDDAVVRSFLRGECVAGLAAQRDGVKP